MESLADRYNTIYETSNAFSGPPLEIVSDILKYRTNGTVLDMGAGRGRNSLFLASKGFRVTAIDLSPAGIDVLRKEVSRMGLDVDAHVGDVSEGVHGAFDVVVSAFVLHHCDRPKALEIIADMQLHTNTSGLNVISAFTEDSDFFRDAPAKGGFYAGAEELQKLYEGWDILEYREERLPEAVARPDGTHRTNTAAFLLARKRV